jgi:hypothetical protein
VTPNAINRPDRLGSRGRIRTFGRGSKVPCLTAWLLGIAWLPECGLGRECTIRLGATTVCPVTLGALLALGNQMRKTLLLAVLVLTLACGTYRFPGQPPSGTGTVSGQVTAVGCGGTPKVMCVAPPMAPGPATCVPDGSTGGSCGTIPVPGVMCPAPGPANYQCGPVPVPGLELDFASGSTTMSTTTDSNGNYSIELPVGSWNVSTKNYMQIISGPTTVTIAAGASVVANYTVWSRIAYTS